MTRERPRVATCLWFDGTAQEAARFHTSLIEGTRITGELRPDPAAPPVLVEFTLAGTPYQALNGGPQFRHSEAASIAARTLDQAETDRLWFALTADGGRGSRCGGLVDRFGVWWQIVPEALMRCLSSPDPAAAGRASQAMLGMGRIDVAAIEAAFAG